MDCFLKFTYPLKNQRIWNDRQPEIRIMIILLRQDVDNLFCKKTILESDVSIVTTYLKYPPNPYNETGYKLYNLMWLLEL